MCCRSYREAVRATIQYYTRALANVKTQVLEKNVISSLLHVYTYKRLNCLHGLDFSKVGT